MRLIAVFCTAVLVVGCERANSDPWPRGIADFRDGLAPAATEFIPEARLFKPRYCQFADEGIEILPMEGRRPMFVDIDQLGLVLEARCIGESTRVEARDNGCRTGGGVIGGGCAVVLDPITRSEWHRWGYIFGLPTDTVTGNDAIDGFLSRSIPPFLYVQILDGQGLPVQEILIGDCSGGDICPTLDVGDETEYWMRGDAGIDNTGGVVVELVTK